MIKMNSLWKNCSRVTNLDRYFRKVVRVSEFSCDVKLEVMRVFNRVLSKPYQVHTCLSEIISYSEKRFFNIFALLMETRAEMYKNFIFHDCIAKQ